MKKKEFEELRNMATGELENKLNDARQELMNLRFQIVTGQLTDTSRLEKTRRLIARYMTLLSERAAAEKEGQK